MFLCCGDALFDLFVEHTAGDTDIALAGGVGGSPLNVAIGLARLGHKSYYFTKLSQDTFGQRMRRHLEKNSLDTTLCVDTDQNTTLAIVEKKPDGAANYVFYTDNTADASITIDDVPKILPEPIQFVHVASYSTVLPQTGTALLSLVQQESKQRAISYDPNVRLNVEPNQSTWQKAFEQIAPHAFLIKASDEDVETLVGAGQFEEFFTRCFSLGAQVVFLTLGAEGAWGADCHGQRVQLPGLPVNVVDTVGAGDTFQAAVMHWLAQNRHVDLSGNSKATLTGNFDLEACVRFALSAAAITCSRRGADLPSLSDVEAKL